MKIIIILSSWPRWHTNFCTIKDQVTSHLSSVLPMHLVVELSAPPTPIAWWCHMSDCHLSATELSRLVHMVCGTVCLAKLHLLSHCIHSGDISKHSCFSDLFRMSLWHSSGPSHSAEKIRLDFFWLLIVKTLISKFVSCGSVVSRTEFSTHGWATRRRWFCWKRW